LAFIPAFERAGVYQLSPPPWEAKRKGGETRPVARRLFADGATYDELSRRLGEGAAIRRTLLTEAFGFEAFRLEHGPAALPLFIMRGDGRLVVWTAEDPPEPLPGDVLISLVGGTDTAAG
jgi:hypothetical protein